MDESQIRSLLPHAWHPFFGRFGRLRDIQLAAVPPIVEGEDVLVGAPTASGKTEAVVAPLVERIFQRFEYGDATRSEKRLRLLVVTPTRALCRDLHRRLQRPVRDCGLTVDVKTGDASPVDIEADPPDVLVTTPESLDSLLCRAPKGLRHVCGAVLDELHLLDGEARGDQLRALVERLRQVVGEGLQLCGASATLPNGESLARAYLGDGAQFVQRGASEESTHRGIDAELVEAEVLEAAAEAITSIFQRGDDRKLLVFANTRSQVESLTAQLTERDLLRDRVHAHHGSLSRAERHRAEDQLRDSPSAICVASMTLEVGIDIGDVDRAILVGPPPNVSSLLQRIGRSNRQDDVTRVTCLYSGRFERWRTAHLLECAARGELFEDDVPFRPSVIGQQGLSLMFQNPKRWVSAEALQARLPDDAQRHWTREDCQRILESMGDQDVFHPMRGDRFAPDEKALRMYEYGQLHSNIEDDQEVEVVDELTRQTLGRVRFSQTHRNRLADGEELAVALGGERREVVQYTDDDQLVVRSEEGVEGAQFIAQRPPRYSRGLAADFARFLDVPPRTLMFEELEDAYLLFHFMGTLWGRLLEFMLRARGEVRKRGTHGAFFIHLNGPIESEACGFEDRDAIREAAEDVLREKRRVFVGLLGAGPFARFLPQSLADQWVRASIELDRFVDLIASSEVRWGGVFGDE